MKSRLVASLLIASLLGTSVAAVAQQNHDDHGPNQGHSDNRGPGGPGGHGPQDNHDHGGPPSHNNGHGGPQARGHGPAPRDAYAGGPGGPVPHNDWHKGERLPSEYRNRSYVVDDYRGHGLQAPPRGYQWVGVNGDYVLAAVATGVIASVLLSTH
ncbi:Ni/Co efflux regulator RcnB [Paraburkholderia sp. GAS199]|uniref:RcnB family protein n=1 Tax=Paraburkholderia sp. GAS199 TaxID=3035126 RepID=UPI003D1FCEFD